MRSGIQVGYSVHFQLYGSRMGERQRWASVAAQYNGLLQSRHPTYDGNVGTDWKIDRAHFFLFFDVAYFRQQL